MSQVADQQSILSAQALYLGLPMSCTFIIIIPRLKLQMQRVFLSIRSTQHFAHITRIPRIRSPSVRHLILLLIWGEPRVQLQVSMGHLRFPPKLHTHSCNSAWPQLDLVGHIQGKVSRMASNSQHLLQWRHDFFSTPSPLPLSGIYTEVFMDSHKKGIIYPSILRCFKTYSETQFLDSKMTTKQMEGFFMSYRKVHTEPKLIARIFGWKAIAEWG